MLFRILTTHFLGEENNVETKQLIQGLVASEYVKGLLCLQKHPICKLQPLARKKILIFHLEFCYFDTWEKMVLTF